MTILHILKSFITIIYRRLYTTILKFQINSRTEQANTTVRNFSRGKRYQHFIYNYR